MRNRIVIVMCVVGVSGPAIGGESSHQMSPTQYWFCESTTNAPAYSARVVTTVASSETNEGLRDEVAMTRHDLEKSFFDFLARGYGFAGRTTCLSNESRDWIESDRTQRLEALRNHKIPSVETDWVYAAAVSASASPAPVTPTQGLAHNGATGVAAAPPKPRLPPAPVATVAVNTPPHASNPPPVPAAPQIPYAYCWGQLAGLTPVAYFGAPFEASARNVPAWSAAYKKFLVTQYKFAGGVHCNTHGSLAETQQHAQNEAARLRVHWKVIETGWKYQ